MGDEKKEKIREYLDYFRMLEKQRSMKEHFFLSISVLLLFFLGSLVSEHLFFLGFKGILLVRLLFFGLAIFLFYRYYLTVACWGKFQYERLALLLEERIPDFDTHLINAWQLGENRVYPRPFIELLKQKTLGITQKILPDRAVDIKKLSEYKKIAVVSLLFFLLYIAIYPRAAARGFLKMFFPANGFSGYIRVEPGNCIIEEGAPLTVKVYLNGSDGIPLLEIRNAQKEKEKMDGGNGIYSLCLPGAKESFAYRIIWGNRNTDWYGAEVKSRTILKKLFITCDYPSYTGLGKTREEKPPGEISVLSGTKVTVEALFSNPVEDVSLELGPGKILYGKGRGRSKTFSFHAENTTLYRFRYYDTLSGKYRETEKERFNIIFDRIPYIEFMEPGRDIYSKGGESIGLSLKARDDFGVTSVTIRKQAEKGSVSDKDQVICRFASRGQKEFSVSHSVRIPKKFDSPVAYYAECADNSPSGNRGFSSVYYIYPFTSKMQDAKDGENKVREDLKEQAEQLKSALEKFAMEEKKLIEAAKRLDRREDRTSGEGKTDEMSEIQKKWKELFQKMVDDLNRIASQTKGKFTLADELVEMISHIQSAGELLEKKAVHMAIPAAQTGLELAKEITSNLEKWMAEIPDYIKWDMEDPQKNYEVPEAPLPDELEDIIGELLEQEEDMRDEIEDITSKWMDSLDKGAGWGAMDGPMSNMSAKGVTGNLMPNQQEIGGRSGEGRTGRSYGEMVENTATGKGGRKTPARLTPDNLEPGEIQDTSGDVPFGPTGGGKISGWGPEGLEGPQQDIAFRYDLLAARQQKIIEKTESVIREMKVLNVYNPELEKALSGMKDFQVKLRDGRYRQNMLTEKNLIISHLRESDSFFLRSRISKIGKSDPVRKTTGGIGGVWDEKIPSGYENIVRQYYREIYKK
ncbi:MAG TPA: hypothetical protein PKN36_00580 [bacterium]|nr:hypothetical protein [bacterium]